jgi:guanine nucleotide-binding protein alpha-1 subunit
MPRRPASPDPLNLATRPPIDETSQQRAEREQAEAEALRISAEIDAQLEVRPVLQRTLCVHRPDMYAQIERENLKKKKAKREVKVVLLGQAESGTVLSIDTIATHLHCYR